MHSRAAQDATRQDDQDICYGSRAIGHRQARSGNTSGAASSCRARNLFLALTPVMPETSGEIYQHVTAKTKAQAPSRFAAMIEATAECHQSVISGGPETAR